MMKKQISSRNTIMRTLLGIAVLGTVTVLLVVVLPRMVTARPDRTENVGTTPSPAISPVSTVQPTVAMSTVTPIPSVIPTFTVLVPEQVQERNYGVWRYKAGRHSDFGIAVNIHYDLSSVAALRNYAAANQALATQLASGGGQAEVYVTFRTYIAPEQFRAWVRAKGVTVVRSMLRSIEPNGNLGTVGQGTHPGDTEPLPQDRLDEALVRGPRDPSATLRGLYFTIITVQASRLPEIAADPLVFIADVTPNVVRNELAAAGWEGVDQATIGVFPNSPFYMMEEFGLENFAR
jgi:hypothetical protein